jgi:hypothetical protein
MRVPRSAGRSLSSPAACPLSWGLRLGKQALDEGTHRFRRHHLGGWALIKVISLAVRGLVHVLVAGLPVLGAVAGFCLLLVLGSWITARTRRQRSLQPSGSPAAPSRRATSAVPAPVLSPERLIRSAAPASRPPQYRRQPSTESGHAEASPASGAERSGMLSASQAARPGLPGYEAAALGYGTSARPGGSEGGARRAVHRTGLSASGPSLAAVPSWPAVPQVPVPSNPVSPGPPIPRRRLPQSPPTPPPGGLVGIDKESAAAGTIRRVVLIDGCSGVQYGRRNEQYSAYRVTLPSVAPESTEALARHLLSDDRKWSQFRRASRRRRCHRRRGRSGSRRHPGHRPQLARRPGRRRQHPAQ